MTEQAPSPKVRAPDAHGVRACTPLHQLHPPTNSLPWPWCRFPEIPLEICELGEKADSGNFPGNLRVVGNRE